MKKAKKAIAAMACAALALSAAAQSQAAALAQCPDTAAYYVKKVVFPAGADLAAKVDMASRLVPTPEQAAWQDLELTAFLHFGMNTFTDREWGDGQEDPALFNPEELDTDQWVRLLRESGFKLVILTAKHHDGFCLWPTATTTHSVASSPWRGGKGDVVADLAASCRKYGMKLGLYLSPWDRNAPCYGDSPLYNDLFAAQLTELLSLYGQVDEVWFDGACGEGPNGKRQQYDWPRYHAIIDSLQPQAVTAIMGDDVRWVGNERGLGRDTEWSATALTPGCIAGAAEANSALGLGELAADIGSRALLEKADSLRWWPSEVDVSIRPGWFYHDYEKPKSLRELAYIYEHSVGRNSVLLLNIPPDRRGLISEADSVRLSELRSWIDASFTTSAVASVASDPATGSITAVLSGPANAIVLAEDIRHGQRVEAFDVCVPDSCGLWRTAASGTTVGHKRIVMLDDPAADSLRIAVRSSRGTPHLTFVGAYDMAMPEPVADPLPFEFADRRLWRVLTPNVAEAAAAIDGDKHTAYSLPQGQPSLAIDLGAVLPFKGMVYTPRTDGRGAIFRYQLMLSADGCKWEVVGEAEYGNMAADPRPRVGMMTEPELVRFVMMVPLATTDGNAPAIADLDIILGDQ